MDPFDIDNLPPSEPVLPATEAQVAAFEEMIGHRLPADYRDYLLTVNGGSPEASSYRGPALELYLQCFYFLVDDEERLSGLKYEWESAYDLPEESRGVLLPIAHANGGDTVCLSLVNGEVLFFDHETGELTRLTDSFTSLLQGLTAD